MPHLESGHSFHHWPQLAKRLNRVYLKYSSLHYITKSNQMVTLSSTDDLGHCHSFFIVSNHCTSIESHIHSDTTRPCKHNLHEIFQDGRISSNALSLSISRSTLTLTKGDFKHSEAPRPTSIDQASMDHRVMNWEISP